MLKENDGAYSYTLGQVSVLGYFAAALVSVPLETIVRRLDAEESTALAGMTDSFSRGERLRDRDVAAVLLDAKRQVLAIYAAYGAAAVNSGVLRDSRPALPTPIDPTGGRELHTEGSRRD